MTDESPLIQVDGLCRAFGAVQALTDMSLTGHAGRVHAVVGENGAGKSTLMKILSGVLRPDAGTIRLRGRAVRFDNARDARDAGISTVFQEFSLLPNLSVTENLFLGRERVGGSRLTRATMRQRTAQALAALDLDIHPDRRTGSLSVGQQQMVEIAKGVLADAQVFIFDEPTAALAGPEVDILFALIRRLAAQGKTVFYISHRLAEVFALCDDITILKDGRFVRRVPTAETTVDAVIRGMVGRPVHDLFDARATAIGAPLLQARGLWGEAAPVPVTLDLHAGEIVGIAGLEGQGQQALMRLLAGFDMARGGTITLAGRPATALGARARMAAGIGFVAESRKEDGLFPSLDIGANMGSAANARRPLWASAPDLRARIAAVMDQLAVKAPDARTRVTALSGGNQQKVVLGRWLLAGTRILLCEEPTRGVDVGAKREIYRQLRSFAADGCSVLVTSRELPELIGLCDRLLVIRDGALVAEMPAAGATEDAVLHAALSGVAPAGGASAA